MKIYTRTGDAGTTALIGGIRVQKCSPRLETYGTIDELNSHLGLLIAVSRSLLDKGEIELLTAVQCRLFDLGAYFATDNSSNPELEPSGINATEIQTLEKEIDRMTVRLPQQRTFLLPGGCVAAAQANIARCVCRRAERCAVALAETAAVAPLALQYLNRLSDYLFTLSRYLNNQAGEEEIPWIPKKPD